MLKLVTGTRGLNRLYAIATMACIPKQIFAVQPARSVLMFLTGRTRMKTNHGVVLTMNQMQTHAKNMVMTIKTLDILPILHAVIVGVESLKR